MSDPIISFTFDDFPSSALRVGGRVQKDCGLVGTYYTSVGLMGTTAPTGAMFTRADLDHALAEGHELGCHTFSHCHAWDTPVAAFVSSVIVNQQEILRIRPGVVFQTLSYPISCTRPGTKRAMATHFLCCCGGGQQPNVGRIDRNFLQSFILEKTRGDIRPIQSLIQETIRQRGSLIFSTNDIDAHPTQFGCTPASFEA